MDAIILTLISFVGLYAGLVIGLLAKEELKVGKKYFVFLQKILFLLMLFFLFFELGWLWIAVLFVVVFVVLFIFLKKDFHRLIYIALGAFLFFSVSLTIPVLIFFYGIPTASIFVLENKHNRVWGLFKKYYLFLVLFFVLYFAKFLL